MRFILKIASLLALIALIAPWVLLLANRMGPGSVKWFMILATIVWFVTPTPVMLKIVSILALIALIAPAVLFLAGHMELDSVKWFMIAATIAWFATATPVMWKDNGAAQQEDTATT